MSNFSFQSFGKNNKSISNSNSLKSTKFLPNNNNINNSVLSNNNNLNNISTITLNPQINNIQNQNKIQFFCHSVEKKKFTLFSGKSLQQSK